MIKLSNYIPSKPHLIRNTNDNQKTKKIKNKGYIRASYIEGIATIPFSLLAAQITPTFKKAGTLSGEQTEKLKPVLDEALQKSGLADKGVKTLYIETFKKGKEKLPEEVFGINFQEILQLGTEKETDSFFAKQGKKLYTKTVKYIGQLTEILLHPSEKDQQFFNLVNEEGTIALKNNTFSSLLNKLGLQKADKKTEIPTEYDLPPELAEKINKIMTNAPALPSLMRLKKGHNAAYFNNTKTVVLPDDNLTLAAFHEMGHAVINNFGKFSKIFQKLKPLSFALPSLIAFVALTNQRKINEEQKTTDSKLQKGKDFVKRNAGKLTFLSFTPVIINEGLASIYGNKIAKSVLPKDLLNRVRLTNSLGLLSYIASGIIGGVGVAAAVKYKDKIQEKYEHKLEIKAQKKAAKQKAKI